MSKIAYHLLNSAMMPAAEGRYQSNEVTAKQFAAEVNRANRDDQLVSYIGYPETAELLSELCNCEIPVSRDQTEIRDGDVLLVAKLKYRVNPTQKGTVKPGIKDFEFRVVHYSKL